MRLEQMIETVGYADDELDIRVAFGFYLETLESEDY